VAEMIGFRLRFSLSLGNHDSLPLVQNLVKGWRLIFGIKLLIPWGKYW